jgi:hypothetical protein
MSNYDFIIRHKLEVIGPFDNQNLKYLTSSLY